MKKIDCTPTWREALPILTSGIKSRKPSAQLPAYQELSRMAQAADLWNEHVNKIKATKDKKQKARK